MGGITSKFKFESYKIDELSLKAKEDLSVLGRRSDIPQEDWSFSIAFRKPQFFKQYGVYIGGIELDLTLQDPNEPDEPLVTVHAGIAGMFSTDGLSFPKGVEQSLVKIQIPAILMPYLRATIMTLLASAGFGTAMLPLINIQELAKETLVDVEVAIIDTPPPAKP